MKTLLVSGMALVVGIAGLTLRSQTNPSQGPASKPAVRAAPAPASRPTTEPASRPAGKVVATVNGEPIYESEVMAALPDDAFQEQLAVMKKAKLQRLVEEAVQAQLLKDRKIAVSDDEVTKAFKDFERMVKTPGCPCCGGGYESLDQFMKINAYAMPEIRRRISCDIGMRLYVERLKEEHTSPQALAEAVKKHRARIEADYAEAYGIMFNYVRDPEYLRDEKTVQAKKDKSANEVLQRLKNGESFEKVAREVSEDEASAVKGGALGCVRISFWGREVEQVFRTLEPGTYSGVVKATWGCCIVMRKKLTEADILSVVKEQETNSADEQMYKELRTARERAKIQYGMPSASAPAPLSARWPSEAVPTDRASR